MHKTELSSANYRFGKLNTIDLEVELGPSLEAVYMYTSTHGTLSDSGGPIPLSRRSLLEVGPVWASIKSAFSAMFVTC